MSKFYRIRKSLAFNIVSAIIVMIIAFSLIIGSIGYVSFTSTLKREYETTTHHMADAARSLIDPEMIDDYLNDQNLGDYNMRYGYLKSYCDYMDATLIHVFSMDQSDYLTGTNIFNVVNTREIEEGNYSEWERGFVYGDRFTANYQKYYEMLYNKEVDYVVVFRTKNLRGKVPHLTIIVPVKDSNDNIVALLSVQRPMSELINGSRPYMITIAISTAALVVLISLVAALYLRLQFVKPIKNVIEEAKNFSAEKKKGNLNDKKSSSILEIRELSESVNTMENDMLTYIENLTNATSERERIVTELNIASVIQENSIPNKFPAFPDRLDFDIFANMEPAKEIGGDFYNFYLVDEDNLAIVIADVSGKGIPAALFMMVTNILLNEKMLSGQSVKDTLTTLNDRICKRNIANMFVTVWLGKLNLKTGVLTFANAGHNDAIICRHGKKFEIKKTPHDLVIAAMEDVQYSEHQIKLQKGDKLFLYTDGVVEATNANNELFTEARMREALSKLRSKSPSDILKGMKHSIDSFVGDAPQFDDITMMLFEYKDKE